MTWLQYLTNTVILHYYVLFFLFRFCNNYMKCGVHIKPVDPPPPFSTCDGYLMLPGFNFVTTIPKGTIKVLY